MALAEEFINAVDEGKVLLVRIMLKDSMLVDPTLNSFNEMLSYAQKKMTDLFDKHNGENLIDDPNQWTKEYMNKQMYTVVSNFSKERIDLLKKIVTKIYGVKPKEEKTKTEKQQHYRRTENHQKYTSNSNRQLAVGLAVGGGVVAVAGICLSKIVIAAAGGVVAAVGVGMLISEGKD